MVLAWFVDTIAQGLLPLDPLMLRLLRLVKLQLGLEADGEPQPLRVETPERGTWLTYHAS